MAQEPAASQQLTGSPASTQATISPLMLDASSKPRLVRVAAAMVLRTPARQTATQWPRRKESSFSQLEHVAVVHV
jgi:hypothetical protein